MIKRTGEKEIFKTEYITIKDIYLDTPKGKTTYQIIEKRDTALIVPINSKQEILFIKEFYVAANEYGLSLPKGRIDKGYDPLQTAGKELQEEIGFKAMRMDKLAVFSMSPGYLTQKTHVFLARDLIKSRLQGDELEDLEVIPYSFNQFEELIVNGTLTESRSIAALFLVRKFLKANKI